MKCLHESPREDSSAFADMRRTTNQEYNPHYFYISNTKSCANKSPGKYSSYLYQNGFGIRANTRDPRPKTREDERSRSPYLSKLPFHLQPQLIAIFEGAKHHKPLSASTKWVCSREINSPKGEESLILV
jgi:hypothetical protein